MKHERMASAHPRRSALRRMALACTAFAAPSLWAAAPTARIPVEVWKDPNCGCCQDWVVHMEHNGFAVTVHDTGNSAERGPEYGGRKDPYEVLLITKNLMNSDVSTRTFTSYR